MEKDIFQLYKKHVNPMVDEILSGLGVNKKYIRAEDHVLTYMDKDGNTGEILDLAGGYGSLILGHNHPEIVQTVKDFLDDKKPVHIQISYRPVTAVFAERLAGIAKKYVNEDYLIRFANTGAEAVDLAMKHCEFKRVLKMQEMLDDQKDELERLKILVDKDQCKIPGDIFDSTDLRDLIFDDYLSPDELLGYLMRLNAEPLSSRPSIYTLKSGFHGKTIGASQMTYSENFRKAFSYFGLQVHFIDKEDLSDIEELIEDNKKTFYNFEIEDGEVKLVEEDFPINTAVIIEPIQGEGGIKELTPQFVQGLRKICDENKIPLVFDEIQTGMGRTGTFFASQAFGVTPEIYLLAKSITGGVVKNSCVLIKEEIYEKVFGVIHTSTFGEDCLGSAVGLKVLDLLEADDGAAYKRAASLGDTLINGLREIQKKYPQAIKDVRGRGLMIGVEFRKNEYADEVSLLNAHTAGTLGWLIFSYLHEIEGIRAMPTASFSSTIRLEPGISLTDSQVEKIFGAFERVAEIIEKQDGYHLLHHFGTNDYTTRHKDVVDYRTGKVKKDHDAYKAKPAGRKVAFIGHYLGNQSIRNGAEALDRMTEHEMDLLTASSETIRFNSYASPVRFKSVFGSEVDIDFYVINQTAEQISAMITNNKLGDIRDIIHEIAVDAKKNGCGVLGFGGFSSIITNNCKNIPQIHGLAYTSGNSLTAGLGYQALLNAAKKKDKDLNRVTGAIVGAAGNIGQVYTSLLSENLRKLVLIGSSRKGSMNRLIRARKRIYKDIVSYILNTKETEITGIGLELMEIAEFRELLEPLSPDHLPAKIGGEVVQILEKRYGEDPFMAVTSDTQEILNADLITCVTNATKPFIGPELIKENAVVCDLGVPLNVKDEVLDREDVEFLQGGLARTPDGSSIPKYLLDLPKGKLLGCVAETIIMGLMGVTHSFSYGDITRNQVKEISALADTMGFRVATEYRLGKLIM